MNSLNPKVDAYLGSAEKWREEMRELRRIVLGFELAEDMKWGQPCYTFQKGNVVIISAFKEYCALGFFKGALLKDANGILTSPGPNSRSMRQMRFTDAREVVEMEPTIRAYVQEAIEVEQAGLKVEFDKTRELEVPEELQAAFDALPALKTAFDALTPGRQRAYILYFSAPKQSKTRTSRIEKHTPRILDGLGMADE